jgi:hypothetical protein
MKKQILSVDLVINGNAKQLVGKAAGMLLIQVLQN